VEESLHRLPAPDAVIANPPRAGLAEPVSHALRQWAQRTGGARMSYVSCDPATLARDLSRMPGLVPRRVTAYDLFPQTSHVETVAVLEAA
jgi:tRNA/tmRNA/rRNA uracil-C5-methylase (TrmA/RlmC/RlmD family)